MKIIKAFLCGITIFLLAISCSKDNKNPTADKEREEIAVSKEEEQNNSIPSLYGINVRNGEIRNNISVPIINNIIIGIEDEFSISESITEPVIVSQFGGFGIGIPISEDEKSNIETDNDPYQPYIPTDRDVKITAKYKEKTFTKTEQLSAYLGYGGNNILCYCVPFIAFENKFWINSSEKWEIIISLSGQNSYQLNYNTINASIFYRDEIQSPFEITEPRQSKAINRNIEYTYRFLSKTPRVVVVYHSEDYMVYKPLLCVYSDEKNNDRQIKLEWTKHSMSGIYTIRNFDINEIPKNMDDYPVFDFVVLN